MPKAIRWVLTKWHPFVLHGSSNCEFFFSFPDELRIKSSCTLALFLSVLWTLYTGISSTAPSSCREGWACRYYKIVAGFWSLSYEGEPIWKGLCLKELYKLYVSCCCSVSHWKFWQIPSDLPDLATEARKILDAAAGAHASRLYLQKISLRMWLLLLSYYQSAPKCLFIINSFRI